MGLTYPQGYCITVLVSLFINSFVLITRGGFYFHSIEEGIFTSLPSVQKQKCHTARIFSEMLSLSVHWQEREALEPFWKRLRRYQKVKIKTVAIDMSAAYIKTVRENLQKEYRLSRMDVRIWIFVGILGCDYKAITNQNHTPLYQYRRLQ